MPKDQIFKLSLPQIDKEEDGDEECRTPTSQAAKIPIDQSCPPPPRKRKRKQVIFQKRKFPELQFFEVDRGEEVELFFQSSSSPELSRVAPCSLKKRHTSQ
ncbi:unnamed protein product [Ilex paraguariensis]|uniref:Uncharacterized protein n=1 Tax=Ilex paraguariensis TaxID=185542 RepID=A0ABC8TYX7_9AQUA